MLNPTEPKNRFHSSAATKPAAAATATAAAVSTAATAARSLNSLLCRLMVLVLLCGPVGNAFRGSDRFDKGWCPSYCAELNEASSNDVHPCSGRYVFVIAAGRSGSTTVLNMLNSLPGLSMSGENSGALKDLVQYWNHSVVEAMNHDGTRRVKNMHATIESNFDPELRPPAMRTGPWMHNDIQSLRALPKLQELYRLTTGLGLAPTANDGGGAFEYAVGSKVLGHRLGNVFDTVMLASKLFPCSKFVWSVRRSHDEWYESLTKLKFGIEESEAKVLMHEMDAMHQQLPKKQSLWLELETFSGEANASTVTFNKLANFLKFPAEECRFANVMHSNRGRDGYGAANKLPEVLGSRQECTAKLKTQLALNSNYFRAGEVGVDGAPAVGTRRPLDWRCAPTCRNYYADHSNGDGTRRDLSELSALFRWKELCVKVPGFKRGPVEPYVYLYRILPQVDTVVHTPLTQYWRAYRRRQKTMRIPKVDVETEAMLKDQRYNALVWGAIEAAGHADPWRAPCEIESTPRTLLPTLDPPIAHLKDMTLITIEPLYKIKGPQLCTKHAIDCSAACWAKHGSISGPAPNVDCLRCQEALFTPPKTIEMCFLVHRSPRSLAVPYPTNFVPSNDRDTMMHILAVSKRKSRPELMTYASSDHGTFSQFRATLRKQCAQSNECTHYDCTSTVACKGKRCSICATPMVARRHLRAKFSLQPPGDSPTRQSMFDTLIQGCIPVFFSTCAQPDLLYETMYAPFLPVHARTSFGAGSWAVVLDARKVIADPLYVEKSLIEIAAADQGNLLRRMQKMIKAVIPRLLYPQQHANTTVECISTYKYAHYIYFDELVKRGITTLDKLKESTDFWAAAYFRHRSLRESSGGNATSGLPDAVVVDTIVKSGCIELNTTTIVPEDAAPTSPSNGTNGTKPGQSKVRKKPKYRSYRHKMQVLNARAMEEKMLQAIAP